MYEYRAHIRSIYDADTIRADLDLGFGIWTANQSLRLLGIDAPEMGTPEGKAARDYLRAVLPVGTEIVIRTRKDEAEKYGRWLATVLLNGEDINAELIQLGYAVPYGGGAR